jgi:hypothetical protein
MTKKFSWSFSALTNFETCPKKYYHYDVLKDVVETGTANREGLDSHASLDQRIRRKAPLPIELSRHETLITRLEKPPGQLFAEQKLAISSSFTPTGWFGADVWLRVIIDAAKVIDTMAIAIDWKTGKPKKDQTQLELIAAVLFTHIPDVTLVRSALVFLNHDVTVRHDYQRADLPRVWAGLLPRVKEFERAKQAQEFPPKPNGLCRKWCAVVSCPFHGRGG